MGRRGRALAEREFSWSFIVADWMRQLGRVRDGLDPEVPTSRGSGSRAAGSRALDFGKFASGPGSERSPCRELPSQLSQLCDELGAPDTQGIKPDITCGFSAGYLGKRSDSGSGLVGACLVEGISAATVQAIRTARHFTRTGRRTGHTGYAHRPSGENSRRHAVLRCRSVSLAHGTTLGNFAADARGVTQPCSHRSSFCRGTSSRSLHARLSRGVESHTLGARQPLLGDSRNAMARSSCSASTSSAR